MVVNSFYQKQNLHVLALIHYNLEWVFYGIIYLCPLKTVKGLNGFEPELKNLRYIHCTCPVSLKHIFKIIFQFYWSYYLWYLYVHCCGYSVKGRKDFCAFLFNMLILYYYLLSVKLLLCFYWVVAFSYFTTLYQL